MSAPPVNVSSTGATQIWCYSDGEHSTATLAEIRVLHIADPV